MHKPFIAAALKTALENLSGTMVIDQPDAPAVLEPAPGELDAERELLADQGAADQLTDAALSLEEILDSLAVACDEEGGLNPQATRFAQLAAQAAVKPLGMEVEAPALESAMSDRLVARLTMESVADTLQKVMHQIIEFCRRLWQQVAAFLDHLFDRLRRMSASAKQLAAQAREKQAWELPVKEFNLPLFGLYFDGVKDPGPWLEKVGKLVEFTAHGSRESLAKTTDAIVKNFEKLKEDEDAIPGLALASPVPTDIFKEQPKTVQMSNGMRQMYTATMRGGYLLTLNRPYVPEGVDRVTPLARIRAAGTEVWTLELQSNDPSTTAKAISNRQLEDMLTTLSYVCDKVSVTKAELTREIQAANVQVRQFESLGTKLGVDNASRVRLQASHAFQRLQRAQMAAPMVFIKYLGHVGTAYLGYAHAHLGALKAPAAA
jgi:hypothetical protein